MKLLLENYEENGVAIRNEDVNIAISTAADHPSCVICHICISSIPDIDIHYNCGICSDGDFYICQDCIRLELFVWIIHHSHKLVKCKIKDGTVVEVPD